MISKVCKSPDPVDQLLISDVVCFKPRGYLTHAFWRMVFLQFYLRGLGLKLGELFRPR